jgi:adenosylcobinamide kinase/adenosylcobinamide-phosphate guanylyltransferase
MAKLILIVGGARSGKSRFAQQLAVRLGSNNVDFIATAEAGDSEMARRIQVHQRTRPAAWVTQECPTNIAQVVAELPERNSVVLLDCVTLLVSNLLLSCGESPDADVIQSVVDAEVQAMLSAFARRKGTAIVVSGEVGQGPVPEYPLGRLFRDLLGWANQSIAAQADEVYLMVAGFPVEVRALATTLERAAANCMSAPDAALSESDRSGVRD